MKRLVFKQILGLLLLSAGLAGLAGQLALASKPAYQFPIHQYPFRQHLKQQLEARHHSQHIVNSAANRRSDEEPSYQADGVTSGATNEESEAQQLRQLHQVVDTMAQLLNEEDQLNKDLQQQQSSQINSNQPLAARPQDLLSESDIRFALEELERVQRQERQNAIAGAESRLRPTVMGPPTGYEQMPSPAALSSPNSRLQGDKSKQSEYESLLNELGDEIVINNEEANPHESARAKPQKFHPTTISPTDNGPATTSVSQTSSTPTPARPSVTSGRPEESRLLTGQLDELAGSSDLGSDLTDEFYNFHSDSTAASGAHKAPEEATHDLEQAAQQTRSSVVQRENVAAFSQPPPTYQPFNQQQAPQFSSQQQENLVRAFRQQTGANNNLQPFADQFGPSSTPLSHLPVADNFWRPTGNNQNNFNNDDLSQQFNRASNLALPAPRFQSLPPSLPFAGNNKPPTGSSNQAHPHFPGHAMVASSEIPATNSRQPQAAPMISVLSGGESLPGSNTVSWNPPPVANFNQQFPGPQQQTSTQPPSRPLGQLDSLQYFQPPPAQQQQPQVFRSPHPGLSTPQTIPSNGDSFRPATQFQNNNFNSNPTERNFPQLETTTTSRGSQWSQPAITTTIASTNLANEERESSDSRPRSSFRALQNENRQLEGERFFSPNELQPNSGARFATPTPPIVTTTTPANEAAGNTTKKEDMVIYYYYYYDDNKNATVVAKNISGPAGSSSTGSPMSLDAAIEADGGVEDTPYMDDPVPAIKPIAPLTTTTTLPSTTTGRSSTIASNRFESSTPPREDLTSSFSPKPNRQFASSSPRTFAPFESTTIASSSSSRPPQFESRSPFPETSEFSPQPSQGRSRQSSQSNNLPPQSNLPPVSTSRGRQQQQELHEPQAGNGNRLNLAPPSSTTTTTTTSSTTTTTEANPLHHHNSFTAAPSARIPAGGNRQFQPDLIQSVPNGGHRHSGPPQVNSNNINRVPLTPLSNASRYGTNNNNNHLLDPYAGAGLEPVSRNLPAPAQGESHQQHRNAPVASPGQFNRVKPIQEAPAIDQARKPSQSASRAPAQDQQHFSSMRNSGNSSPSSSRGAPVRVPSLPAQPQQPKQIFPEQSLPSNQPQEFTRPVERQQASIASVPQQQPPRQQLPPMVPQNQDSDSDSNSRGNNFADENNSINRIVPSNGRPLSMEGNTGNGFTRAPPTIQSSPAASTALSSPNSNNNNIQLERRLPQTTTVSTSVSRSFVSPQQVVVTSSVSPVSSSSSAPTTTTENQPSITTIATQATTTTEATPTSSTSSTVSSSSSETPTSGVSTDESGSTSAGLASARNKKFGNRNNRFQTRLSSTRQAAGSSTTSTTSTTPSPSSTTRRPIASTTRRSNKQLFSGGRRRLPSSTSSVESPGSNSSVVISTSTAFSVTESSSSSPPIGVAAGRTRFGNSFTARTRTSTSTAAPDALASSTPRPSNLFGSQNRPAPAARPRSFGSSTRLTKPAPVTTSETQTNPPSSEQASSTTLEKQPDQPAANMPPAEEGTPETSTSQPAPSSTPSEPAEEPTETKKEVEPVQTTTTSTPAPSIESTGNGRLKPKVRPLFASRQRNSSLFGNRRNNATSSSA